MTTTTPNTTVQPLGRHIANKPNFLRLKVLSYLCCWRRPTPLVAGVLFRRCLLCRTDVVLSM